MRSEIKYICKIKFESCYKNRQIAKLDQMLQQTRTPENRYSLSGESAKKYKEVPDDIQKCEYSLWIHIIRLQKRCFQFHIIFCIIDLLIMLQTGIIKDSQLIDAIVWEDPNHPKRVCN